MISNKVLEQFNNNYLRVSIIILRILKNKSMNNWSLEILDLFLPIENLKTNLILKLNNYSRWPRRFKNKIQIFGSLQDRILETKELWFSKWLKEPLKDGKMDTRHMLTSVLIQPCKFPWMKRINLYQLMSSWLSQRLYLISTKQLSSMHMVVVHALDQLSF